MEDILPGGIPFMTVSMSVDGPVTVIDVILEETEISSRKAAVVFAPQSASPVELEHPAIAANVTTARQNSVERISRSIELD